MERVNHKQNQKQNAEARLSLNGPEYFNEVNADGIAQSLKRIGIQDVTISID